MLGLSKSRLHIPQASCAEWVTSQELEGAEHTCMCQLHCRSELKLLQPEAHVPDQQAC